MKKAILWTLSVLTLCSVAVGAFLYIRDRNVKAPFKDLIFPVIDLKTGKLGYMDISGNIVIQPVYNYANEFQGRWQGLTFVRDEAGYKLIDKLGNVRSQSFLLVQYYPAAGVVLAGNKLKDSDEMRFGYFNLDGSVILQPEYIQLSPLLNGRAFAQMQDKHWYIIDKYGDIIKKLDENIQYIQVTMIPSGYVAFTREGNGMDPGRSYSEWMLSKWGYMDIDGNVIFEMNDADSHVTAFENGRALISKAYQNYMKMYIIDLMGNVVVDLGRSDLYQYQYQGAGYFSDGVACILNREKVKYGAINSKGNG
jgi:hypothetical protein